MRPFVRSGSCSIELCDKLICAGKFWQMLRSEETVVDSVDGDCSEPVE